MIPNNILEKFEHTYTPSRIITDWRAFNEAILTENTKPILTPRFAYRGQSNIEWALKPSLIRCKSIEEAGPNKIFKLEGAILLNFSQSAHLFGMPALPTNMDNNRRNQIHLMNWLQHYGGPTRTLDWTRSPAIALYFAVKENLDKDAAIWLLDVTKFKDVTEKNNLKLKELPNDFEWGQKSDKNFAEYPQYNSKRSQAQQVFFTIAADPSANHDKLLESDLYKSEDCILSCWRIPSESKRELLRYLYVYNIHGAQLFPDLEGQSMLAKEILIHSS